MTSHENEPADLVALSSGSLNPLAAKGGIQKPHQRIILGASVLTVAIIGALFAFFGPDPVSFVEVERVTSPDKKYDAIVVENNGGANTSSNYLIYLVPAHQEYWSLDTRIGPSPIHQFVLVGDVYGGRKNQRESGVNLRWEKPRKLTIEYYQCLCSKVLPAVSFDLQQFAISEKHAPEGPVPPN